MSPFRQIAVSAAVLALVAGAWFAYDGGWLGGSSAVPLAQGGPGGAGAGPGQARGGAGGGIAAPVVTAAVGLDNAGFEVRAVGTVAAARAITLYPEATGIVAEVAFRPGTQVSAGQPLVRLEDAEQQVAVERARIALDVAQEAMARAEQLSQTNNITNAALAEARTAVQRAEIDLRGAELELARRTLTAPFSGTIGLSDVTVGDLANSSRAIASLDDMSTVTVAFEVPERVSGRVAVGQELSATTAALAGRRFIGQVSAVDSRVDPVARTLKVEASLPNEANVLKPGMALSIVLAFAGEEHLSVPSVAVQWDRGGPYVWKVTGDTVTRADVDIVTRHSGVVVAASADLTPGDQVVAEGLQRMREGIRINRVGGESDAAPAVAGDEPPEAEAVANGRRPPSG